MSKFENNLTEGSVSKNLIRFSMPFLLSNLVQSVYSVADLFIVGRFNGPESIAGVNTGSQLTMLVTNIVMGLATGGTILVAQYLGANKHKDMKDTIGTMFTLMIILAGIFTVAVIGASDFLLNMINTPPEAFDEAKRYLNICMMGTIFIFGYNAISAILRGMGDSKNPLYFVIIACIVNVFLDLLLVGVFNMRASGAAIATVAAQALSMIISIIYLSRSDFVFKFTLSSFRIKTDKLKMLLLIGLPTSLSNSISNLSFLFLSALVNAYGVNAAAGVGIVSKVNNFAILPTIAMSMSIASVAGQNIGAGLYDRAKDTMRVGMRISLAIGTVIFAVIQLFPAAVVGVFTDDPAAIEYGVLYIRSFSFDYLIVPFTFCANGLINGSGHTLFVAAFSTLGSIVLRVPFAAFLGTTLGLGLTGIGLAVPISSFGVFLMSIIYIQTGKWRKPKVIQAPAMES